MSTVVMGDNVTRRRGCYEYGIALTMRLTLRPSTMHKTLSFIIARTHLDADDSYGLHCRSAPPYTVQYIQTKQIELSSATVTEKIPLLYFTGGVSGERFLL